MSMNVFGCSTVGFAWYIFFKDALWVISGATPVAHLSSALVCVPPACVQTHARLFSAYLISVMFLALLHV